MKILAIDTSSANCCVAISECLDDKIDILVEKNNDDEKTHSQKLMPMVDQAFKEANLSLNNIDLVACSIGPGSFTGIRIGIASCKAFVDSKNIKATGISSLESLAYNVTNNGYIISLIDCKNSNVYGGFFYNDNGHYEKKADFIADNINIVLATFLSQITSTKDAITFVGDASILYKNLITESASVFENVEFCDNNTQNGISLTKCAYSNFKNGKIGDSNMLSPLYLRASQAEQALKNNKL